MSKKLAEMAKASETDAVVVITVERQRAPCMVRRRTVWYGQLDILALYFEVDEEKNRHQQATIELHSRISGIVVVV